MAGLQIEHLNRLSPERLPVERFRFRIGWMKHEGKWMVHDCELLEVGSEEPSP